MIPPLEKSYKAITCARCGAAIPLSAKMADLREGSHDDRAATPRTFHARCRSCENEGVYTIDSIRNIEGEPPNRKSRKRAVVGSNAVKPPKQELRK
jgi:hypothetical protein